MFFCLFFNFLLYVKRILSVIFGGLKLIFLFLRGLMRRGSRVS